MAALDSGELVLLGAPLGDPRDASPRLAEELARADVVAAEDTRRLRRLAAALGVRPGGRIVSYFEGNERDRTPELLQNILNGLKVAVITDGGMPSVSDPGFRLVRAAADAGAPVRSAPGPSAVTTALAVSGLPCDRFCFEGFLPRRPGDRKRRLAELAAERRTMIFFESPRRIAAFLEHAIGTFGAQRKAALCRELTKTFEEVRRGELADLAAGAAADPPRGEITVVVSGAEGATGEAPAAQLAAEARALMADGAARKEAMTEVARRHGMPRRAVFDALLEAPE